MSSARPPAKKPTTPAQPDPEKEALVAGFLQDFCEYARILSDEEKSIVQEFLASQATSKLKCIRGLLNGQPQKDYISGKESWQIKEDGVTDLTSLFVNAGIYLKNAQGKKHCAFFVNAPLLPRMARLVELHKGKVGAALGFDAVFSIAAYFALKKTLGTAASAGVAGGIAVAGIFIMISVLLYNLRPSAYRSQIDNIISEGIKGITSSPSQE